MNGRHVELRGISVNLLNGRATGTARGSAAAAK
eukprot:CAMPEP_0175222506 /NCGR_PEP_ID=MMETSP0093-20121207/20860_1 /TAXON_ID=311494 /ORGANISM="Alexandrium monilatum, Strain CCMP3105" /LENGTH=32 /DNA_ID= /DNA_START= /DNA_END= /DNA_ORIENTATION=